MLNKEKMMIYRPDISKYQVANFRETEASKLESISNLSYHSQAQTLNNDDDIIIISTSNTSLAELTSNIDSKRIKLWIHPNSGYDNLSLDFVKSAHFPIIVGNSIRANAVYLYTVQCFLDSLGKLPVHKEWDKNRSFNRKLQNSNHTLVIGHGHIGKLFTNFLENSNFSFDICDPYLYQKTIQSFNLATYDQIVFLSSLNESSLYMADDGFFNSLKDTVTIINPARGKLVKEDALIDFLSKNPNAQAYFDVFENEPMDFSQFETLSNIYLSSHIAGVYNEIDDTIIEYEYQVISDFKELPPAQFEDKYQDVLLKKRIKDDILI